MKRRTRDRLAGTAPTRRSSRDERAAARNTERSMGRAYRQKLSGSRHCGCVTARLYDRPVSGRDRCGYLCRVNFDAYARTAVDLVNADMDELAGLQAVFADDQAWMRDEVVEKDLAV